LVFESVTLISRELPSECADPERQLDPALPDDQVSMTRHLCHAQLSFPDPFEW
jgi:hypothetical protein